MLMKQWKKCWGYVPVDFGVTLGTLENVTQKMRLRLHARAEKLRVRFTNRYHTAPLAMETVTVGKWKNGQIQEIREIYCGGKSGVRLAPGESCLSDEVDFRTEAEDEIIIAAYFKETHEITQVCQTWNMKDGWKACYDSGNTTASSTWGEKKSLELYPVLQKEMNPCEVESGISAVLAFTEKHVREVACFGDSITHMSFYFEPLLEKLSRSCPGEILMHNCGIGGNRLLFDDCYVEEIPGHGKCFGEAGLKRFERDVYEDTVPDFIFLMEGVNDCTHGFAFHYEDEVPDGEQLMTGLKKIVGKAHARGSRILVSTVMPFGCLDEPFREKAEAIRQDFNRLIRANKELYDGFVDLDEEMRKPEDRHLMRDGLHMGDGVHPNEAGGKAIAETVGRAFCKYREGGIINE